jgi:hypothetical protein
MARRCAGSGSIDRSELREALNALGLRCDSGQYAPRQPARRGSQRAAAASLAGCHAAHMRLLVVRRAADVLARYDVRGAGALSLAEFKLLVSELKAFTVTDEYTRRGHLDRPRTAERDSPPLPRPVYDGRDARPSRQSRNGWVVL